MPKVPEIPKFKPSITNKIILCFPPDTSMKDRKHDTKQIEAFIASIKLKKKT